MAKKPQQNDSRKSQLTRDFDQCSLRAMTGEGNERKFELSFSSEEPYTRYWGVEILDHSNGAMDITRLSQIGCVLFNHNRDAVIGKVNRVWIENNRGCAEIEIDTDEESEKIYQKIVSGTLKGVSVQYRVDSWEEILPGKKSADGRFTGPADVARKWTPYEISIVSVPADPTVGVGRAYEDEETVSQKTGVSSFYYNEKQLQINNNLLRR